MEFIQASWIFQQIKNTKCPPAKQRILNIQQFYVKPICHEESNSTYYLVLRIQRIHNEVMRGYFNMPYASNRIPARKSANTNRNTNIIKQNLTKPNAEDLATLYCTLRREQGLVRHYISIDSQCEAVRDNNEVSVYLLYRLTGTHVLDVSESQNSVPSVIHGLP